MEDDILILFEGLDPNQIREFRQRLLNQAAAIRADITRDKTPTDLIREQLNDRRARTDAIRARINQGVKKHD